MQEQNGVPKEEVRTKKVIFETRDFEAVTQAEMIDAWEMWLLGYENNAARSTVEIGGEIIKVRAWLLSNKFQLGLIDWALNKIGTMIWCGHSEMTLYMADIIASRMVHNMLDTALETKMIDKAHYKDCTRSFSRWYLAVKAEEEKVQEGDKRE